MNRFALKCFIFTYTIAIEIIRYCVVPLIQAKRPARNLGGRLRGSPVGVKGSVAGHSTVWLHGASLGESKLLSNFLDLLRKKHPSDRYILTATTVSGTAFLERRSGGDVDAVGILPYDTPGLMQAFLRRFNVRRVWIMETELWPAMLWACARSGVPVGVVNGRIEPDSYRWYRRFKGLISPLMANFDVVLAQTKEYADRYAGLGIPRDRIKVTGNLKSRVTIAPPPRQLREELRRRLSIAPTDIVITAGCLHPGEGVVLASALADVRGAGQPCRCIVVPRHIEKGAQLSAELDQSVELHTLAATSSWSTCVVAQYGILDDCYLMADYAVVGGTYIDIGGHNLWDAARYGIPVLFGPHYQTQKESAEQLVGAGVGFRCTDGRALSERLLELINGNHAAFENNRDRLALDLGRAQMPLEPMIP